MLAESHGEPEHIVRREELATEMGIAMRQPAGENINPTFPPTQRSWIERYVTYAGCRIVELDKRVMSYGHVVVSSCFVSDRGLVPCYTHNDR